MPAVAGYATSIKVSSDSAALVNAACTALVVGTKYQLTAAASRVLDPAVAIVVKDNGVTVSAALYTVDALFGIVTFVGYTATGPVTVSSASKKNTVAVIDANDVSMTFTADMQDRTVFSSSGWKQKQATLQDFSADLSALSTPRQDQDPGAATQTLYDLWAAETPVLLEVGAPGDTNVVRAWCLISEIAEKATPGALATMSVKLTLAPQQLVGRSEQAGFGYGN